MDIDALALKAVNEVQSVGSTLSTQDYVEFLKAVQEELDMRLEAAEHDLSHT
jgi:hypothetical protein